MAALSHFSPHFLSLPSQISQTSTSFSLLYYHDQSFLHANRRYCNRQFSVACLASTKKSRPSRKLLNDEELCNVLREFVVSVGLPQGHVPSTKELSDHGRKDLANIVRRRGHKFIKELLSSSAETGTDGFDSLRNIDDDPNENSDNIKAGQEEKPNILIDEPTDIPLTDNDSGTGTSLVAKHEPTSVSNDENLVSKEPPMSLLEKVENFMKYGQLDTVEDNMCGDLILNAGSKHSSHGQNLIDGEPVIHSEGDDRHLAHVINNFAQNGTLSSPRFLAPPTVEERYKRDIHSSAQGRKDADLENNMHTEAGKMDNEMEINCLKQMLHQKELELSRLKEDIEREKQALSILQAKAENEISKAQKLITEKDAELNAAEESLSGLVEAKIQYSGEGQMVEVAGSFNGWHQRIKLDPQLSSVIVDPVGTRKPRLWSTTLWLYPGLYEIKFIVDGQWKIDPQIESTMKGGIENNIFRVDR